MKWYCILGIMIVSSCKQGWTQKDKQEFLGGCINGALKDMGAARAKSYCDCMLQKIQGRYPNAGDVKYIKNDTAIFSMAKACRQ
jgi:hypothetical protein